MLQILEDIEQFVHCGVIDILEYVDHEYDVNLHDSFQRRLGRINNLIATTRFVGNGKAKIIDDHPETSILSLQYWYAKAEPARDVIDYGMTRMDIESFTMACKWARYIQGEEYYLPSVEATCSKKHVDEYLRFFYGM